MQVPRSILLTISEVTAGVQFGRLGNGGLVTSGGILGAVPGVEVEEGRVLPLRLNIKRRQEVVISQGRLKLLRGQNSVLVSKSLFSIHAETYLSLSHPIIFCFLEVLFHLHNSPLSSVAAEQVFGVVHKHCTQVQ